MKYTYKQVSKATIVKLIELCDLTKMESSEDMQYALEDINELLETEFAEEVADYILNES